MTVISVAVVGLAVVLAVGAVVWFVTGDAPAAVDISSAVDQAGEASTATDTATPAAAAGSTAATAMATATATAEISNGPGGQVWTVDTSIGDFSISDSSGTFVGFRVDEEVANVGATTAVIRTPEVDGTVTLDDTTLVDAAFEADFTALVSDESRREDAVQRALDTGTHPTAAFVLTEPVELGALPTADQPAETTATGELTVNGVTKTVDVPLQIAVTVDDIAVVTGSFDVALADYDVKPPTAPIVLSVADSGTVELQLFLTRV